MDYYFPQGLLTLLPSPRDKDIDLDKLFLETTESLALAHPDDQLSFISKLFQKHVLSCSGVIIPSDFLQLSLAAMLKLSEAGRTNVVYNLVKAIGTKRPNSDESRLPVTRMPMGLLEHCVNFYSSTRVQQV